MSILNFNIEVRAFSWALAYLLLVELTARLFWQPYIIGEGRYSDYSPSYDYGYNFSLPLHQIVADYYVFYPTEYRPFHLQKLSLLKGKNEIRIFTLGGSISKGEMESNYSNYLEKYLNNDLPSKTIKIINLSVEGYGSSRMLGIMGQIKEYQPDLVIIDVAGTNEYEDKLYFEYMNKLNSGFLGYLYKSHAIVLMKKIINTRYKFGQKRMTLHTVKGVAENLNIIDEGSYSKNDKLKFQLLEKMDYNMQYMIDIARNYSIPVVLIGRANPYINMNNTLLEINHRIINHSENNNLLFFNTQQILADKNPAPTLSFFEEDENHYSDRMHRLIAKRLSTTLRTENVLH